MTLWLLRPAWVSFKSDRNCRLQKLWLADKAICKETSSDACVCMGVCVSVSRKPSQPPLQGRQSKGRSWEIMKYHQIPFVDMRNVTRGRRGVSGRAAHEMCQPLWAGCRQHSTSFQCSGDNSNVSEHSVSTSVLNRVVPHSLFASSTHRQQNTTAKYLHR